MGRSLACVAPEPAFHVHCAVSAERLVVQCLSAWNLDTVWFIFQTLTLKIDLGSLLGRARALGGFCCVKLRGRVPMNPWTCAREAPSTPYILKDADSSSLYSAQLFSFVLL